MTNEVVYEDAPEVKVSPFVAMTSRDFITTIVTGAMVGLIVSVAYFLLNKFVFGAVLCRPQSLSDCAQAPNYSMIIALIIGSIAGVASLARARIYRPLLIAIAAAIALWGIHTIVAGFVWYVALLVSIVLFALAYGLFGWIARIRNFIMAAVVLVVLVVLIRWVLVA